MIKAVVFDMGGVVLVGKFELIIQRVSEKLGIDKSILEGLGQDEYEKKALTGKMSHKEFLELLKKKAGLHQSIEQLQSIWKAAYLEVMPVNEGLLEIAKKLKKKYKVALLSNLNDFHAEITKERGLFEPFDPCLLSCEVGLAKPDPKIFELVLKKMKLLANECVFVDDRERHLKPAKEMGFQTILFKNNEQLVNDLQKLGVS
ncbi:MAG: HAD family phosphatase [Candidatus Micrarchaeota archaeon]